MHPLTEKRTTHQSTSNSDPHRTARTPGTVRPPVLPEHAFAALPNGPNRYISAKPIARYVPDLTQKVFQKHGFSSVALIAEWSDIVGPTLAQRCLPERLKWPRANNPTAAQDHDGDAPKQTRAPGATLILRTDAAYALEIEYESGQIIERINAYFGYRAITALKIVQGPLAHADEAAAPVTPRRRMRPADPAIVQSVDRAISGIEDAGLKAALSAMRQSVLADS